MSTASVQAPDSLTAIQGTIAELRSQRLAWERDVTVLFDDFDALAVQLAVDCAGQERLAAQSATDDCWRELSGQHQTLAKQQEASRLELSAMRELVEQQTELLTAFIGAATQFSEPAMPVAGRSKADPVVSAVQAQFAQLNSVSG